MEDLRPIRNRQNETLIKSLPKNKNQTVSLAVLSYFQRPILKLFQKVEEGMLPNI